MILAMHTYERQDKREGRGGQQHQTARLGSQSTFNEGLELSVIPLGKHYNVSAAHRAVFLSSINICNAYSSGD